MYKSLHYLNTNKNIYKLHIIIERTTHILISLAFLVHLNDLILDLADIAALELVSAIFLL